MAVDIASVFSYFMAWQIKRGIYSDCFSFLLGKANCFYCCFGASQVPLADRYLINRSYNYYALWLVLIACLLHRLKESSAWEGFLVVWGRAAGKKHRRVLASLYTQPTSKNKARQPLTSLAHHSLEMLVRTFQGGVNHRLTCSSLCLKENAKTDDLQWNSNIIYLGLCLHGCQSYDQLG